MKRGTPTQLVNTLNKKLIFYKYTVSFTQKKDVNELIDIDKDRITDNDL